LPGKLAGWLAGWLAGCLESDPLGQAFDRPEKKSKIESDAFKQETNPKMSPNSCGYVYVAPETKQTSTMSPNKQAPPRTNKHAPNLHENKQCDYQHQHNTDFEPITKTTIQL
jgi:hypothetical protein